MTFASASSRWILGVLLYCTIVFAQEQAPIQQQYYTTNPHGYHTPVCPPGAPCAHTSWRETTTIIGTTTETVVSTHFVTEPSLTTHWVTSTFITTMLGHDCTVTSTKIHSTKITAHTTRVETQTVYTPRVVTSTTVVTSTHFAQCTPGPGDPGPNPHNNGGPGPLKPAECRVLGYNYELYHNQFQRTSITDAYLNFDPSRFGHGSYITKGTGLAFEVRNLPVSSILPGTDVRLDQIVFDVTFYLYSPVAQIAVCAPIVVDIGFLWVGDVALGGWNRHNAQGVAVGGVPGTPGQQLFNYEFPVAANSFTPIRFMWATSTGARQVAALLEFNILGSISGQLLAYREVCPPDARRFPPCE